MTQEEAAAWVRARFPPRKRVGRGRQEMMNWMAAAECLGLEIETLRKRVQGRGLSFRRQDMLIIELREANRGRTSEEKDQKTV